MSIVPGGPLDGVLVEVTHETSVMVDDVSHALRRSFLNGDQGLARLDRWWRVGSRFRNSILEHALQADGRYAERTPTEARIRAGQPVSLRPHSPHAASAKLHA